MVRLIIFIQLFEGLNLFGCVSCQFTAIDQASVKTDHGTVFGDGKFDGFLQMFYAFLFPGSLGATSSQIIEQVRIFFHIFVQFAEACVCFIIIFICVIADSQIV